MYKRIVITAIFISAILGCKENDERNANHLSICSDFPSCTTIVVNSQSGLSTRKCEPIGISLEEPCFSDSLMDSINLRISIPTKSHAIIDILDNDENLIETIVNDTLVAGYYSFTWEVPNSNEIYGCFMSVSGYEKKYWFYAN